MKRLLVFDVFRGPDSTGLAAIRKSGEVKIAKIASHPLDLFDSGKFKDALNAFNSVVLLGHNRLATKGKVNGANAHPYQYGHIVGAHNGTLDKTCWDELNSVLEEPTDVDSQAIFACFEKIGVEETVKRLKGAWALVWVDLKEGTLNFLRNKERPFWYAYDKGFRRVFWASEHPMIRAAVSLSAQPYEMAVDDKGHSYYQTAEDWWYRFDLDALAKGFSERPKPRASELKGKEPTPAVTYHGTVSPFKRNGSNSTTTCSGPGQSHQNKTSTTTSHGTTTTYRAGSSSTKEGDAPKVVNLVGTSSDPVAGAIDRSKFDEITQYGCSWCGKTIEYGDVGISVYEDQHACLCAECTGANDGVRIYLDPVKLAY